MPDLRERMPDYWLDADSFIVPHRGPYRFTVLPQFWEFLAQKAKEGIIASPQIVLEQELSSNDPKGQDELEKWAKQLKGVMFREPFEIVQASYREVAQYVQGVPEYKPYHLPKFLAGADPWVIAFAKAYGGRIVTFEIPQPQAKRPKIPDVAGHFNIHCLNIYDMLGEMKWCLAP